MNINICFFVFSKNFLEKILSKSNEKIKFLEIKNIVYLFFNYIIKKKFLKDSIIQFILFLLKENLKIQKIQYKNFFDFLERINKKK